MGLNCRYSDERVEEIGFQIFLCDLGTLCISKPSQSDLRDSD
jgi:hypothetical protein